MADRVNLNDLVQRVFDKNPELEALQPAVVKELVHHEIMWSLDKAGLLRGLTFHGGTALRLCYGASRLSEDIDFTGGPDFTWTDVAGISGVVQSHLAERYGLEVSVQDPKPRKEADQPVAVDRWQISVVTDPGQFHLPRQRIRIDVATMEARTRDVKAVRQNYSVLPTGLGDLLVPTMSKDEIMANKLVSLPASAHQGNIRHRDIWDIAWLAQNGAELNHEWVANRVAEFRLEDYADSLDMMQRALPDHVAGDRFRAEMSRFLPRDVVARTLDRPEFVRYLANTVNEHLAKALATFSGPKGTGGDNSDLKM